MANIAMKREIILFLTWLVSCMATAGSLFFSEVMKFPPCILCWYQRIGMYPLVLVLGVSLVTGDRHYFRYAFPLTAVGLGIAVYHNLLYYKLIPENAAPCQAGVSCTTVFFEWLGIFTIPSLSLIAFTLIFASLIYLRKVYEK